MLPLLRWFYGIDGDAIETMPPAELAGYVAGLPRGKTGRLLPVGTVIEWEG